MSKTLKVLLGVGLAYAGVTLYGLYNVARNLVFSYGFPKNWKIDVSAYIFSFVIPVSISNVVNDTIKVNSLNFKVTFKGIPVGNAFITQPFYIPRLSNVVVPVAVVISVNDMFSAVPAIWDAIKKPLIFNFDGQITASNFVRVPINQNVTVTAIASIIDLFTVKKPTGKTALTIEDSKNLFFAQNEPNTIWLDTYSLKNVA